MEGNNDQYGFSAMDDPPWRAHPATERQAGQELEMEIACLLRQQVRLE
jgi:hypothetical protein